jgi:hypothetical protein
MFWQKWQAAGSAALPLSSASSASKSLALALMCARQLCRSLGDHYGEELRQADEVHALALLQKGLKARRWKEADLAERPKGDPEKLDIAWRLRQETTMTLKWIAQKLHTGSWTYLSNLLVLKRKENGENKNV